MISVCWLDCDYFICVLCCVMCSSRIHLHIVNSTQLSTRHLTLSSLINLIDSTFPDNCIVGVIFIWAILKWERYFSFNYKWDSNVIESCNRSKCEISKLFILFILSYVFTIFTMYTCVTIVITHKLFTLLFLWFQIILLWT